MTPTKSVTWLATRVQYRYLFTGWLVFVLVTFDGSVDIGGVSLGVNFLPDISGALFYVLQAAGIAAVDLIFIKGGLSPDRPGKDSWRAWVVLVKWLLLPFLFYFDEMVPVWSVLLAIAIFTTFWPLLVLVGWFFKGRNQPVSSGPPT